MLPEEENDIFLQTVAEAAALAQQGHAGAGYAVLLRALDHAWGLLGVEEWADDLIARYRTAAVAFAARHRQGCA